MKTVVTLGEIMMRLKAPGKERLFQSSSLESSFGGGEANVAVSLANFGHRARFVSAVPPGAIGDACLGELRRFGVDVDGVRRQGERLGLYFLEGGANQRPSRVIYDRAGSAFGALGEFDLSDDLSGVDWFHLTGITPALSQELAKLAERRMQAARDAGVMVSLDLNYRSKLWAYGPAAAQVMPRLARLADLLIGNEEDFQKSLGLRTSADVGTGILRVEDYKVLSAAVLEEYPQAQAVAMTLRESQSADDNGWSAVLRSRSGFYLSSSYKIRAIVDRVGAGDSFAAALIHAWLEQLPAQAALNFATAASALKHSIPGDFNRVSVSEVERLVAGDGSGRVRR